MKTYKLTQVALLEIWDDKKPLFEVEIDGTTYYATSTLYGEVILGPPVPPRPKPVEEKDTWTIFINGREYSVSKVLPKIHRNIIKVLSGNDIMWPIEIIYTYPDGRHGTMEDNTELLVEEGMIFNVCPADKT